jgi:hypothetical protein
MGIPTPVQVQLTPHERTKLYVRHERLVLSAVATFAMDLIKMGAIHGEIDGETSTGHPKPVAAEPRVLVTRSIEIAELTFSALIDKGWIAVAPLYEDLVDDPPNAGFQSK